MAIAKTASRNVAFKVAKMRDSIMEDQDEHPSPFSTVTKPNLPLTNPTFIVHRYIHFDCTRKLLRKSISTSQMLNNE